MSLQIREVVGNRDLKKFIVFPDILYKNDPNWVPALRADELATLKKSVNPAFRHCEARYFLALRDGEVVGRIAAIINHNANDDWNVKSMRFGWYDFIDDFEVSELLMNRVKQWALEKGMTKLVGPLGFSDMDKEGLLVEGFENLPSITNLYNAEYYIAHYERMGFAKEVDWIQRRFGVPAEVPEKLQKFSDIVSERFNVRYFLPKTRKELAKRGRCIFNALNDSFVPLYEFTRLNDKQIDAYLKQYIPFINTDLCCLILDEEDNMVAFAITLPSLSRVMQKIKGKLFPFGFIHLLRALKRYEHIDMYMIGIVPQYQNKGLNAMIFNKLHKAYIDYGVKEVISNPQLENNRAVISLFDDYDSELFMRRRCYFLKIE